MRERRGKRETKEVSEGNEGEERTRRKNGGEGLNEGGRGYLKVAVIKLSKQNVMNWVARPL
jgi:hypothetical protein